MTLTSDMLILRFCYIAIMLYGSIYILIYVIFVSLLAQVLSCRAALVALPLGHPQRPVERDLITNRISTVATDQEHENAYLQFDVHALWITQYFLQRHACPLPASGVSFKCYSRFDDVLGAVETLTLHGAVPAVGAAVACELRVYNWTGEQFCGVHYDPLDVAAAVPPPPPPPAGPGSICAAIAIGLYEDRDMWIN